MAMIPKYATLYKVDANGKISEWSIRIENNPKHKGGYLIITESGQTTGKKTEYVREVNEGKAKRSTLEQAILETNRKWNDKKDKETFTENPDHAEAQSTNETTVKVSKTKIIRPMLAKTYDMKDLNNMKKKTSIKLPVYVQHKYDGIRCLSYKDNKGNIIMESRTGKPFVSLNNIRTSISKMMEGTSSTLYLDGEIYSDDLEFSEISGLVRLEDPVKINNEKNKINNLFYMIYDCFYTDNIQLTYKERMLVIERLKEIVGKDKIKYIKFAETYNVNSADEIMRYHKQFVEEGYEGTILRNPDGPYEIGKRSSYLQKYKDFFDDEFEIIGYEEGTGTEKGAIIYICRTTDGKNTFNVRPQGTFEERRELFKNGKKYIGKYLTVKYQELGENGIPRMPIGLAIRDYE